MPKRPGDQLITRANIDKAGRLLGYEPRTRLQDALAAEVAWYKDRVFNKTDRPFMAGLANNAG